MHLQQLTSLLVAVWLCALVLAGTFGGFGIPGWVLLSTLGALPLVVIRQMRREPAPTMSETIHEARR